MYIIYTYIVRPYVMYIYVYKEITYIYAHKHV